MSLSNISKEHVKGLLESIESSKNLDEMELPDCIKNNHIHYAKLKLIESQMISLKFQALTIIENSKTQEKLHNIKKSFKLVSGQYYYLYNNGENEYFSMISPEEWNNKDIFKGKYYFDYDKQFILS